MICFCTNKNSNKEILEGKKIIKTIGELYTVLPETIEELILDQSFIDSNFTELGLENFIQSVIKMKPDIRITLPNSHADDFNSLKDIVNNVLVDEDKFIEYVLYNRKEMFNMFKYMCSDNKALYVDSVAYSNKLNTLQLELEESIEEIECLKATNATLTELVKNHEASLEMIASQVKYKTGKEIDLSLLKSINAENNSYYKILYIKEISRVKYIDTFIDSLMTILEITYNTPVRLVVMESTFAYRRSQFYPKCKSFLSLTYKDIQKGNIFMAGYNKKLMKDILLNPDRIPYLIILDRTGLESPVVYADNVVTVFTASDLKDVDEVVVKEGNIISYSDKTMYIPHINKYNDLSQEDILSKYSEMNITKKIFDLLERRYLNSGS